MCVCHRDAEWQTHVHFEQQNLGGECRENEDVSSGDERR